MVASIQYTCRIYLDIHIAIGVLNQPPCKLCDFVVADHGNPSAFRSRAVRPEAEWCLYCASTKLCVGYVSHHYPTIFTSLMVCSHLNFAIVTGLILPTLLKKLGFGSPRMGMGMNPPCLANVAVWGMTPLR